MDQRGATLIELILAIVLIGIIAYAVTDGLLVTSKATLTANEAREATQGGRLAIDRMAREIRNVRNSRCVSTATATSFAFIDASNNPVTFSWTGTAGDPLLRNGDILVDRMSALAMTYYDNAEPPNPIAGPTVCATPCLAVCPVTDIWSVNIDMTTESGSETMRFRSQVTPMAF